jgi:hypothetical protein
MTDQSQSLLKYQPGTWELFYIKQIFFLKKKRAVCEIKIKNNLNFYKVKKSFFSSQIKTNL